MLARSALHPSSTESIPSSASTPPASRPDAIRASHSTSSPRSASILPSTKRIAEPLEQFARSPMESDLAWLEFALLRHVTSDSTWSVEFARLSTSLPISTIGQFSHLLLTIRILIRVLFPAVELGSNAPSLTVSDRVSTPSGEP